MKKSQNKVVPQGTLNRVPVQPEGKQKKQKEEEKRPGSAISRDFMPKKQSKIINQWKRTDSQDESKPGQTGQSVQTPFGYVPFKSVPTPIYGNRANPNGQDAGVEKNIAVANYMQNAYQSPQIPRPESVMTATDINSRPGSELGIYRLPSRYQSYTTLPRPEQVPMEVGSLNQNSIYGIPKVLPQHARSKSMERGSIYGTAEKRPLSQLSGSRSLHTIHTEPYLPPLGSKALSFYGLQYDDESSQGLKPIIPWPSLNAFYIILCILGMSTIGIGAMRLYVQSEKANGVEMIFGLCLGINGILGLLAGLQHNYSLSIFTFVMAFFNFVFCALPFYVSSKPFIQIINDQTTFGNNVNNVELQAILFFVAILSWFSCLVIIVYGCRAIGKAIYYVESLRLQNALSKSAKDIRDMHVPA